MGRAPRLKDILSLPKGNARDNIPIVKTQTGCGSIMRVTIDTTANTLAVESEQGKQDNLDIYSKEAFEIISDLWLKTSWQQKYSYTFSWLGRPVIQHPEDLVRIQEAIYEIKPDVIIETGIAHGGSLIFYASLLQNIGKGRVVGVDIEIRPHNREAIEAHELFSLITLIEGDAVCSEVLAKVSAQIKPGDTVMVILDSNHRYDHVKKELEAYSKFVTSGSYLLVQDGIMQYVFDTPMGEAGWVTDNPIQATRDFLKENGDFYPHTPDWPFNESDLQSNITGHPEGWLRKK